MYNTSRWDGCAVSAFTVQQGGMVVLCLRSQYNKVGWLCYACVHSTTRWDGCAVPAFTVQQGGIVVLCLRSQYNKVGWLCCVCVVLGLSVQFNKVGWLCCVCVQSTTSWDGSAVSAFTVQQGGMVVHCAVSECTVVLVWLYVSECTVKKGGMLCCI